MAGQRNDLLADLARDAAFERSDFLARAGEQLERFMADNADKIRDLGGLTLIDEDPDYLAVAPDGTFRSRSRVFNELSREWQSETEVIETGGELVELYNPADIFSSFVDVAKDGVWSGAGAEASDAAEVGGSHAGESNVPADADPYAGAADRWAAAQPDRAVSDGDRGGAGSLYDLALDFQDRSQRAEAGLLEAFEHAAAPLMAEVGTIVINDDLDEHLELGSSGFRGRVIPEGETRWKDIGTAEDIVGYYDPTDVFADLADAIADAYPGVSEDDHDHDHSA